MKQQLRNVQKKHGHVQSDYFADVNLLLFCGRCHPKLWLPWQYDVTLTYIRIVQYNFVLLQILFSGHLKKMRSKEITLSVHQEMV